jgi:hypothetical protein
MTSTIEPERKRKIPPGKVHFYFKNGAIMPYVEPVVFKEVSVPKERHVRNRPGHVSPLHKRKK